MKQIMYISIITILAIGLVGIFLHFTNQTNELQTALEQKESSIDTLNSQINQLNTKVEELNKETEVVEQEIGTLQGKITLKTGNCMPSICENQPCESSCSNEGVARTIYIRELTNSDYMDSTYLQENNKPKLIETSSSAQDGTYTITLPAGKYSMFVEDDGKEYCNRWNLEDNSCSFEITKDQITEYDFEINHAAS